MCREFPIGLHTCNKRSNKEELELLYPRVNFDDKLIYMNNKNFNYSYIL